MTFDQIIVAAFVVLYVLSVRAAWLYGRESGIKYEQNKGMYFKGRYRALSDLMDYTSYIGSDRDGLEKVRNYLRRQLDIA